MRSIVMYVYYIKEAIYKYKHNTLKNSILCVRRVCIYSRRGLSNIYFNKKIQRLCAGIHFKKIVQLFIVHF